MKFTTRRKWSMKRIPGWAWPLIVVGGLGALSAFAGVAWFAYWRWKLGSTAAAALYMSEMLADKL